MKGSTGYSGNGAGGLSGPRVASLVLWGVLLALLAALALASAWGCGEETTTVEEVVIEIEDGQPADAGVDQDADEDLAAGADALLPEDLPTDLGTQQVYLANSPGDDVPVNFSLNGPWNFSGGPDDSTLSIAVISKTTAPSQEEFPEATIAARSTWSPGPARVEYNFQHKDEGGWVAYGRSGPDDRLRVNSAPVRVLVFPASVGDSWTEVYTETEDDRSVDIQADNLVMSRNRLTVPAGTYDAYLLQTQVTATEDGVSTITWDYIWFVPGIGRAAEIISLPDEEDDTFDTAAAFYRLDSFRIP